MTLISVHRIFFFSSSHPSGSLYNPPPTWSKSHLPNSFLSAHFILSISLPKLQTNHINSKFNTSAFNTCILNYFTFQKAGYLHRQKQNKNIIKVPERNQKKRNKKHLNQKAKVMSPFYTLTGPTLLALLFLSG